jgi:hypothetical protein
MGWGGGMCLGYVLCEDVGVLYMYISLGGGGRRYFQFPIYIYYRWLRAQLVLGARLKS